MEVWGVPIQALAHPLLANALNGKQLVNITHISVPLQLHISGNHQESVLSDQLSAPSHRPGTSLAITPQFHCGLEKQLNNGLEPLLHRELAVRSTHLPSKHHKTRTLHGPVDHSLGVP